MPVARRHRERLRSSMPKSHRTHNLERASHHAFGLAVAPFGWTVTRINDDYGLDDRVEIVGDGSQHAPGLVFHVQHKATSKADEEANWLISDIKIGHVRYWQENVLPFLVSLYFSETGNR